MTAGSKKMTAGRHKIARGGTRRPREALFSFNGHSKGRGNTKISSGDGRNGPGKHKKPRGKGGTYRGANTNKGFG